MSSRRSRSEIVQNLQSTQPWPNVLVEAMSETDQSTFRRRKYAVDLYISGDTVESIKTITGVNNKELHRLLVRAVRVSENGLVYGYRALIPQLVLGGYERSAPVRASLPENKAGYAGVLGQVFAKYPKLKEHLDDKILKRRGKGVVHEHSIKPKALHKCFIDYLKKQNHPEDQWPFNTIYNGYRTIATYMQNSRGRYFDQAVIANGSQSAKAHLSVGTGKEPILKLNDLMSAVEIDSHKIDSNFAIGITNAEGLKTYINLKRLNVLALVERSSTAVLWYLVVYSAEVSALDVVRLITESLRAALPKPQNNLIGLRLDEGAGFPAELVGAMRHALPDVLMPDNALANLASAVSQTLRKELGFSLCYGAPGHFEIRPNVEHTFKNLTTAIFQRFPSTTGSTPSEGSDGAKIALKYEMDADVLEELVHFHFARHNITMNEGIGFLTPIEFIRQKLALESSHFIPRVLPLHKIDKFTYYRTTKKVIVRCYPIQGVRPFIQLDRVRYSSDILRASPWLSGKEITIQVDEQDLRVVDAYLPTGEPLGALRASGMWGVTRHGRKTRQAINKLCSVKLLQFVDSEDPVKKYMEYVAAQSLKRTKKTDLPSTKHNSSMGTELQRLHAEVNIGAQGSVCIESVIDASQQPPKFRLEASEDSVSGGRNIPLMPTTMPDLRKLLGRS